MGRVHRIVDRHTHHSHHIAASTKASMTSLILRALVQAACTTLLFAAIAESTTASNQGLITSLPNLNYNPGFRQFSGYLTVSAQHGRSLFYWYVESQNDPTTDPVVLWTNGGPGCSGLIGFWEEHGPFVLNSTLHLSPNPYSWNKVANMLYIEQPAGTGFSYSKTTADYDTADDAMSAEDNYQFILQFLERFPERKSNAFYISGESYAGHYIPQRTLLF
jgi:carboxypeptidase C (cathepsin A)